jgi:hypothetical protein
MWLVGCLSHKQQILEQYFQVGHKNVHILSRPSLKQSNYSHLMSFDATPAYDITASKHKQKQTGTHQNKQSQKYKILQLV